MPEVQLEVITTRKVHVFLPDENYLLDDFSEHLQQKGFTIDDNDCFQMAEAVARLGLRRNGDFPQKRKFYQIDSDLTVSSATATFEPGTLEINFE